MSYAGEVTPGPVTTASRLILSLFPGAGLLDRGFEQAGFCVVRGPDTLLGQRIEDFHVPEGHFVGVIGGPPCQDFSLERERRGIRPATLTFTPGESAGLQNHA